MESKGKRGWHKQPWRAGQSIGAPGVEVTVQEWKPVKEYVENGVTIKVYPPGWAEGGEPGRTARPMGGSGADELE